MIWLRYPRPIDLLPLSSKGLDSEFYILTIIYKSVRVFIVHEEVVQLQSYLIKIAWKWYHMIFKFLNFDNIFSWKIMKRNLDLNQHEKIICKA